MTTSTRMLEQWVLKIFTMHRSDNLTNGGEQDFGGEPWNESQQSGNMGDGEIPEVSVCGGISDNHRERIKYVSAAPTM